MKFSLKKNSKSSMGDTSDLQVIVQILAYTSRLYNNYDLLLYCFAIVSFYISVALINIISNYNS